MEEAGYVLYTCLDKLEILEEKQINTNVYTPSTLPFSSIMNEMMMNDLCVINNVTWVLHYASILLLASVLTRL